MTDAEKLREQLRDAIMEEYTQHRSCYIHPDQAQEEADLAITVIVEKLGITEECSCYQRVMYTEMTDAERLREQLRDAIMEEYTLTRRICRSCQKNIRAVRTLLEASTND